MEDYYVYVYIDPRNFEEFYFGKGKGNRKYAHLSDESDSKKKANLRNQKGGARTNNKGDCCKPQ